MTSSEDGCHNCRFWQPQKESFPGFCRRFPPVPRDAGTYFPLTMDFGWCGEWKRKTQ